MPVTVSDVFNMVDALWPFENQESWDNSGLLVGDPKAPVHRALCALDVTEAVAREAVNRRCELIISHHPLMFRGTKRVRRDDPEGGILIALISSGIAHIAAHTNYDNGTPGVSDALAEALGLQNLVCIQSGMRLGTIPEMALRDFKRQAENALSGPIRQYGEARRRVQKVAVLGGSGGDYAEIALQAGADVFLTGETGYHDALTSLQRGMATLEAGHAATEWPAIHALMRSLQAEANRLQYTIEFLESDIQPFL